MSWRVDASGGGYLHENFTHDNLQRLTSAYSTPSSGPAFYSFAAAYDGLGNNLGQTMGTKPALCAIDETDPGPGAISELGTNVFCYDARGNQVRTLDPANSAGLEKRKVSYTSYDLAREIRSNNPFSAHTSEFAYGPGRELILRKNYGNATPALPHQTFYAGGAEIILKPGTTDRDVRRSFAGIVITQTVSSTGSLVAQNVDVLLTDVLGSTHRLTDTNGVIRSGSGDQYFSPFGVRSSASNGLALDGNSRFNFDDSRTRQGFTGHQQVDPNGLIHMGARLYDPVLARFIQADSMVPEPTDLQSLNRYSYVSNNPLAYTDPTGHWGAQQQGYLRTAAAIAISVYTAGAVSPAVAGGTGSFMGLTVTSANAGAVVLAGGFAAGAVQTGTLRGATTGAFSAAISFGIGNAFYGQEMTTALSAQRALAHAAAGGFTEAINGGNFGHGFVSAGISVAFEPAIDTGSKAADATLHAMLGGTASELSGGKFANGAMSALMSYAFNQLAHKISRQEMMKKQAASANIDDYDTTDPTFHDYKFSSRLCMQSPSCQISNLALLANPDSAPRWGSVVEGLNVLHMNNPIYHSSYFDQLGNFYMVNVTDAAHDFHAGAVVSRLVNSGGAVHLETHGFGYGATAAAKYFNYLAGYGYFALWQAHITGASKIESGQIDPRALK